MGIQTYIVFAVSGISLFVFIYLFIKYANKAAVEGGFNLK